MIFFYNFIGSMQKFNTKVAARDSPTNWYSFLGHRESDWKWLAKLNIKEGKLTSTSICACRNTTLHGGLSSDDDYCHYKRVTE